MSRLTLRELHELGLAWPRGPVPPPEDPDASFDLLGEATGCESLYHDYKGDTRYLDQKALFEELAAKVARKPRRPSKAGMPEPEEPFVLPITKRKLAALGLEWPWPYPFDLDDPLDLARAMTDLSYGDLMDYTGGRGGYLTEQRSRTEAIIQRLEQLGIAVGRPNVAETTIAVPVASTVRTSPGFPAVAKIEPAAPAPVVAPPPSSQGSAVTRRKLAALGVPYPSAWSYIGEDAPIEVERELANLEVSVAEGRPGYADDLDAARSLVSRLDELRIAWRKTREPERGPVTRRKLKTLGLSLPFTPHLPFALDEPIDLEDVLARLEDDARDPRRDRDDVRRAKDAIADIVRRLGALGPDLEK